MTNAAGEYVLENVPAGTYTLAAVKEAHPYEEPVINVIPLYRTGL